MTMERFGQCEEGDVHRVAISGGGLTALILDWGAVIQNLRLAGHEAPLVLGFEEFAHYPAHSPHFGAVPGRYANRIANGRFMIDGQRFQADQNQDGRHSLHGGARGYSRRLWAFSDHGKDHATLKLHSPDGDMGFPGNLEATCTYRLRANGVLSIELTATADQPTLCNLTNHSYFNLEDGGRTDIGGHRLVIDAGAYLPVDADAIPSGVVQPVDGTPFDLRTPSEIRAHGVDFDHNFCLASGQRRLARATWAQAQGSGVEMETWTTEPGVQFYMGHKMKPMPAGNDGIVYPKSAGFCLEAQVWPDSPNHAYFPQAVLRPSETYRHLTEYRFRLG